MNKVLCVFLAIVFICSVFAYGTNERFSVAKWIDNLLSFSKIGTIEDITLCWTEPGYEAPRADGSGGRGEYVYYESYDGGNDVLIWLDSVVGFFKRLFKTIEVIVNLIVGVFANLPKLLPWNATVEVT